MIVEELLVENTVSKLKKKKFIENVLRVNGTTIA